MYKVLVVDDEKVGRTGIRMLLKQTPYDFDIIEAENGRMALNYLMRNDVDFLLTDIKMPFMDGIELIEEVSKIKPKTEMIILSGYSDFDYAKKAIQMGVSEYLLKPIDPNEFNQSIHHIVENYNKKLREVEIKKQQEQLVKEHILYSLVNGVTIDQIERQVQVKIKNHIHNYERMMLLEFENNFFAEINNIEDLLDSIIGFPFDYLNLNLQQSIILFECNLEDKLKVIAQEIIQTINIRYNRKCYVALSNQITSLESLGIILSELEDLIDYKYFDTSTQLFLPKYSSKNLDLKDLDNKIKLIEDDLQKKDYSSLKLRTKTLFNDYSSSIDFLKFKLSPVLQSITSSLIYSEKQSEVISQIATFYHTGELAIINKIISEFVDEIEKEKSKDSRYIHKEVESVKKYIYNNYHLDLSVDQLAEYVCLAPSYLSHIFKKETGENLGKFIKRVRMEKAKDLLENSYEKIVAISVAVGYQNVSYFCQSFREYYGISPQKYRSQGE